MLADRQRLQQVLLNLLSNGVKYNRENGSVTVSCMAVAGSRLRIDVTDTGPGIAADKLERLKSLIEAMGGTVHVQSEAGVGCMF